MFSTKVSVRPVASVTLDYLNIFVQVFTSLLCTLLVTNIEVVDNRNVSAADEANYVAFGHGTSDISYQIRTLVLLVGDTSQVRNVSIIINHIVNPNKLSIWILFCYSANHKQFGTYTDYYIRRFCSSSQALLV